MSVQLVDVQPVPRLCGCGQPANERHLYALLLRSEGRSQLEIADELDVSEATVSKLLADARAGRFPRLIRGHGVKRVRPALAEHGHRWRDTGTVEEIGRVCFAIDSCAVQGCAVRRARRATAVADDGRLDTGRQLV